MAARPGSHGSNAVERSRLVHGDDPDAPSSPGGRRRAAGIYGTIVVAATLSAGGNFLHTWALAVSVVVTLVVYWLAEQYAEILGEHTHAGRLPNRTRVRASLANGHHP